MLELGRYLVGEAGVYVCRVIDRKISRGHVFLITDGGLHHHLAASGNFGQVLRKNYPVIVGEPRRRGTQRESRLRRRPAVHAARSARRSHGARRAPTKAISIAVFQSGAYGFTASPLGFLSHPAPAEILL